jgi:catechol 2,3-dioxygenase-like lactoylglutathione lyase family enzyme
MAKLRHVALQVKDPEATAQFFEQAFEMKRVGRTEADISSGIYLSDGTMNMAILHYKTDKAAGTPQGKDWVGINHIGFWVDDLGEIDDQITAAGGEAFLDQEEPENDTLFFEKKYYTPDGIVLDVSKTGWGGAKKD